VEAVSTAVLEQEQTLQDLLLERLRELGGVTGPLSLRQATVRANGEVSYEVLRLIAQGRYNKRMSARTVAGIATALGVPVDRVYRAASMMETSGPWEPPAEAQRLTLPQRDHLEWLIKQLVRGNDDAEI
jgi:hypothetical protein